MSKYVFTERVWQTADGTVVEDGHPEARTLLGTPGKAIPRQQAEALGLVKPAAGKAPAKPKQRKPAANKQRKPAANKQRSTAKR